MAIVIVISIVIAVSSYLLLSNLEFYVIGNFFMPKEKLEERIDGKFDSLKKEIDKKNLKGNDIEEINDWIKTEKHIYLSISTEDRLILETAWWDFSIDQGSDEIVNDNDIDVEEKKEDEKYLETINNRKVKFADRSYYVYIDDYIDYKIYLVVDNIILAFSFILLLALILIYNRHITNRVIKLYKEVNVISEENLDEKITTQGYDELGALADGVDDMRKSIIEKLANEKIAWNANCQLITAMSHDIRTPLTSLIGYLDIIKGEKYRSEEELSKYVNSCRNKALQLKDLSDKMFEYFLVYGKQDVVLEKEVFSVEVLFEQILGEHVMEMKSKGYEFEVEFQPESKSILTEVMYIKRLFDNIFSNMLKYADKNEKISLKATFAGDFLIFNFKNLISKNANKVESTMIGIKTCETICERLGATFNCGEEDGFYVTNIGFRVLDNLGDEENEFKG